VETGQHHLGLPLLLHLLEGVLALVLAVVLSTDLSSRHEDNLTHSPPANQHHRTVLGEVGDLQGPAVRETGIAPASTLADANVVAAQRAPGLDHCGHSLHPTNELVSVAQHRLAGFKDEHAIVEVDVLVLFLSNTLYITVSKHLGDI